MSYKTAVFALLAIYLQQGSAIKCYTCNSVSDPLCADKVESLQQMECTPDVFKQATTIFKKGLDTASDFAGKFGIDTGDLSASVPEANSVFACVKAIRQDGDKKIVLRSCSVPTTKKFDFCQQLQGQNAMAVTSCDTCDTDGCNGASGLAPSAALFLVVAALATVFARL